MVHDEGLGRMMNGHQPKPRSMAGWLLLGWQFPREKMRPIQSNLRAIFYFMGKIYAFIKGKLKIV